MLSRRNQASIERGELLGTLVPRAMAYAKEAVRRGIELSLADGVRLESDLAHAATQHGRSVRRCRRVQGEARTHRFDDRKVTPQKELGGI